MNLTYTKLSEPLVPPISLSEVKNHLRLDTSEEDLVVQGLIDSATVFCEDFQRRCFINRTMSLWLQELPMCEQIEIPRPPLVSVEALIIHYTDGTTQTIDSSLYEVHTENEPGTIIMSSNASITIPSDKTILQVNPYEIQFTCGYGTSSKDIPANVKQAMLLLIGHWFNNKEDTIPGVMITQIPTGAKSLLEKGKFFV